MHENMAVGEWTHTKRQGKGRLCVLYLQGPEAWPCNRHVSIWCLSPIGVYRQGALEGRQADNPSMDPHPFFPSPGNPLTSVASSIT